MAKITVLSREITIQTVQLVEIGQQVPEPVGEAMPHRMESLVRDLPLVDR